MKNFAYLACPSNFSEIILDLISDETVVGEVL